MAELLFTAAVATCGLNVGDSLRYGMTNRGVYILLDVGVHGIKVL